MVKNLLVMHETQIRSLVGKIPWRRKWLPTPVFWPGELHGLQSMGVTKCLTRLSDFHRSIYIEEIDDANGALSRRKLTEPPGGVN